jgi:hypothetical protein
LINLSGESATARINRPKYTHTHDGTPKPRSGHRSAAGGRTDVPAQLHTEGSTMFIVEGRTLGVFAALGVVLSMVVVFDRLSDVADSTEPRSPAAFATASAAPLQAIRHDDESALPNLVSVSHAAERDGPTARESQVPPRLTPTSD